MILTNIQLDQFKNHFHFSSDFCNGFNIISGVNGVGKTNILDAIYALCTGRCYFNRSDKLNIMDGQEYAVINGRIKKEDEEADIIIGLRKRGGKSIRIDQGKNIRITDYIGMHPAVFIGPSDIQTVNGHSDERRKFLDLLLSQCVPDYLQQLLQYNKLLDMRNKQLKTFNESGNFDPLLLDSIDEQMDAPAGFLYEQRQLFLDEFIPYFTETYLFLSNRKEKPLIEYKSHLTNASMLALLQENRSKDRILERTLRGVHKDDLLFSVQGFPIKQYGSQGQIKSFVISLKLASYKYLAEHLNTQPLLLLDDIFEKIDANRASRLLQLISDKPFGQLFITDTEKERVHQAIKSIKADTKDIILSA